MAVKDTVSLMSATHHISGTNILKAGFGDQVIFKTKKTFYKLVNILQYAVKLVSENVNFFVDFALLPCSQFL